MITFNIVKHLWEHFNKFRTKSNKYYFQLPYQKYYELVDEFRRASNGQTFRIISLSDLLKLFEANPAAIKEVEIEEKQ